MLMNVLKDETHRHQEQPPQGDRTMSNSTSNKTVTQTGSTIPAYFLGRPRRRYIAALGNTRQVVTAANFTRAA
jgi:hypothetical protein